MLSWRLSNTLDGLFCLEALEEALGGGTPEIFNTDQGVQYTAEAFTCRLEAAGVAEAFPDYNEERIHAALDYRTPWAVYREAA